MQGQTRQASDRPNSLAFTRDCPAPDRQSFTAHAWSAAWSSVLPRGFDLARLGILQLQTADHLLQWRHSIRLQSLSL